MLTIKNNQFFRMLRHMVSYSLADWVHAGVHVLLTIIFARQLTPSHMGSLTIVLVTVSLFTIITNVGLPGLLLSRYDKYSAVQRQSKLGSVFWLITLLSILSIVPVFFILQSFQDIQNSVALAVTATIMLAGSALLPVPLVIIRSENKVFQYAIIKTVHGLFLLAAIVPVLAVGSLTVGSIMVIESTASLAALLTAMILSRFFPPLKSLSDIVPLIRLSTPLLMLSLAHFLVDLSDRYIVTWFLGTSATGQYALAARVAIVGSFIAEGFNSMWAPFYYRHGYKNKMIAAKRMKSFTLVAVILFVILQFTLPLAARLRIGGYSIIAERFHPGLILIVPLVSQYFFKFLYYASTPILIHTNKNWVLFSIVLTSSIINVIGNVAILLVMRNAPMVHMLLGISFMTVVSYLLAATATYRLIRKQNLLPVSVKSLVTTSAVLIAAALLSLQIYL